MFCRSYLAKTQKLKDYFADLASFKPQSFSAWGFFMVLKRGEVRILADEPFQSLPIGENQPMSFK